MSALIKACKRKDEDKAIEIFKSGIDVNYINKFGETPLMMACSNRMEALALEILEKSTITTINSKTKNGDTALIYAIYNMMDRVAMKMLEIPEINVNQQNKKGETALMIACAKGLDKKVERVVEWDYLDRNYGPRPHVYTSFRKGTPTITEIINFNEENRCRGSTQMLDHCYVEKMENIALKLLERKDINVNQENKNGKTALDYAIKEQMESVIIKINELKKK